jgi:hypothetical protein
MKEKILMELLNAKLTETVNLLILAVHMDGVNLDVKIKNLIKIIF